MLWTIPSGGMCLDLASGARRPLAGGGLRVEARRAKTRRALCRGLVYDSRRPCRGGLELATRLLNMRASGEIHITRLNPQKRKSPDESGL